MRFGVISTANIAQAVVIPAIREAGHEVVAIASRGGDRASAIASELDIDRAYESYESLFADSEVEAVYNPLPNSLHAKWTKRAADHGLPILCEKPLAVDAEQAREMVAYCDEADVTLMEAFMWRYHPRTRRAASIVDKLGEIRRFEAAFHFPMTDPENIRLDPDLAGGSLMDVGCYPMNATRLFLGEPDRVYARTIDSMDTGVDTTVSAQLEYASGATAQISGSFDTEWVQRYRIDGSEGWLEVEDAFNPQSEPVQLRYAIEGREATETWHDVNQYALEVEAFVEAVESGTPPETGPQSAIKNMELLDAIKASARQTTPIEL